MAWSSHLSTEVGLRNLNLLQHWLRASVFSLCSGSPGLQTPWQSTVSSWICVLGLAPWVCSQRWGFSHCHGIGNSNTENSFVCFVLAIWSLWVSLPSEARRTCTMMFLGVVALTKILFGLTDVWDIWGDQAMLHENTWELLLPLHWCRLAQLIAVSNFEIPKNRRLSHFSLLSSQLNKRCSFNLSL